ncbi:MAG: hypothetical protein LPJ98_06460, partial [Cyclobacteriaceae bacterium]|nr:hypothetical protein [Cyclobacteriaceae bacterium]
GTGTTIVEAKKRGLASVGVEAVPMSQFACRTKVQWQVDLKALHQAKEKVLEKLSLKLEIMINKLI